MKKFLTLVCIGLFAISAFGQTPILTETFDGAWTIPSTLAPAWSCPQTGNPEWHRNDFSTGWTSASGAFAPTGALSTTNAARFHTYDTPSATIGELITPTMDFSSFPNSKRLVFYYINTNGTDVLNVYLSTDGGTTYGTTLKTLGVYAAWSAVIVDLGSTTSNQVKVKFTATSDYGGTDIGIDQVAIFDYLPLTGIKTIDPAGSGPDNYLTFTAAVTALNLCGVGTGGVTFNVASGATFNEGPQNIIATGTSANPIVFQKSGVSKPIFNVTGTSGALDAAFFLNSSDYFTFDGIDIRDAGTGATNYCEYGFYFNGIATDGCKNNTVKNCVVDMTKVNTSSRGIYLNSIATAATGANSFNKFYNNDVKDAYYGYYFNGSSSAYDDGNEIGNISAGVSSISNIGGGALAAYGVYQNYQTTFSIFNTTITNLTTTSAAGYGIYATGASSTASYYGNTIYGLSATGANIIGIYTSSGTTFNIYKNKIYDINYSGTGASIAYGISLTGGTNLNVYNNFIYDIRAAGSTGTPGVRGFSMSGGTNANIYYNTVYLNYVSTGASNQSAALYLGTTPTNTDLRNNIFINAVDVTTGTRAAAFYKSTTSLTNLVASCNYNLYYCGTPGAKNLIFYDGTNSDQTLGSFTTRVAPREAASITGLPPFVSAVSPFDLHLQTTISTQCESGGIRVTSPIAVTSDFDADIRQGEAGYTGTGSAPDIGADEMNGIPSFTCAAPAPGNTVTTANSICNGQSIMLSLQFPTVGTGVSYQWQDSPDGITYTNISGAVSATYGITPTINGLWYQCIVTCQNGPSSATSTPVQITFANTITSTTPATRCGYGTVSLGATGSAGTTINWYTALTGGSMVGTGTTFTTPAINTTTAYYAAAEANISGNVTSGLGALTSTSTAYNPFSGTYGGEKSQFLFTASELLATGLRAGNITALALNLSAIGGTYNGFNIEMGTTALSDFATPPDIKGGLTLVYTSASITPTVGVNTYTLSTPFNWDGSSNIIVSLCWSNNNTSNASATIKYDATTNYSSQSYVKDNETAANLLAFTGSTGSGSFNRTQGRPQMVFTGQLACSSPRSAVIATVTPAPAITASATSTTLCLGNSSTLNVTSTNDPNYTYVWNPGSLTGASQSVSPAATTTYSVVATDASGGANAGCVNTASVSITVNPVPPAITVTPAADTLCANSILQLNVSGNTLAGSGIIGNGTSNTTAVTPFKGYFGGSKMQLLFTASELSALGMTNGTSISQISFNIANFTSPYTFNGFTVGMKNTASTVLTTTIETGLTEVLTPATLVLSGTAPFTKNITLTTPFIWDGTSNLLIETCENNADGGGAMGNSAGVVCTTTATNLANYYSNDNNATVCSAPGAATTSTSRPNVGFVFASPVPVTWSPTTDLYTDAGATVAYTGSSANSVYTKPTASHVYTAMATNLYSCTSVATSTITLDNLAISAVTPVNISCNGLNNGSITVTATGGVGTIQYSIDNGATWQASNSFTGLIGGSYTVLVKDANPCTVAYASNPVVIVDPAAVAISNIATVGTSCFGGSNGTITITAAGGTGALQYSINNGSSWQAGNVFNALPAANYTIKVKDANNCEIAYASNPISVTEPSVIAISNVSSTNISCNGGSNGSITITAAGGTGSLEYSINNGSSWSTSNTFTGLIAASYTIKVKDANACEIAYLSNPVVLTEPSVIAISNVSSTNVSCNAGSDGSITITAAGGTGSLQYSINNGSSWQAGNNFTGLAANSYTVKVKDANNCEIAYASNPVVISEPSAIVISNLVKTDVSSCALSDGTITITAAGGTGSLQYSIDNGGSWVAGNVFTSLAAGNYNVKVKDANSCIVTYASNPVIISTPAAVVINTVTHTNISCNGGANGSITVTASAGTPPYRYSKDGGSTYFNNGGSFTGLIAGTYNITVRDSIGCITAYASNPIVLTQPSALSLNITKTDVLCNGGSNGSAVAHVTGGSLPYTFAWRPSSVTDSILSAQTAGRDTVKVTDGNGCIIEGNVNIIEPSALVISSVTPTNISCFGGNNGQISIVAAGGNGALSYSINNGSTWFAGSGSFSALTAGTYNVQVKDANNCITVYASNPVVLSEPPTAVSITNVASTDVSCISGNNGTITITATGGTGTLQYSINNGGSWQSGSGIFTGLTASSYNVRVKDANNCEIAYASNPVVINQPASAVSITNVVSSNVSCNGLSDGSITVTATGGTGALQYSNDNGSNWQAGNTFTALNAGSYNIRVKDANNCELAYTSNPVSIVNPSAVVISNVATVDEVCFGGNTGSITITAAGGTGSLQYSIDNGSNWQASNIFTGLTANNYVVKVKDNNACTTAYASNPVAINQPAAGVTITTVAPTNNSCFGGSTGSISISATGGTGTLEYSINNGSTWQLGSSFTGLIAGNYNVVVKDASGCQANYVGNPVVISAPAVISITGITSDQPNCNGGADGSLTITATGGTGTLEYSIDNGTNWQTSNIFTGLSAASFTILVKDANSCQIAYASNPLVLGQPAAVAISNVAQTNVLCFGNSTGSITITANGGATALLYSINGGTSFQTSNVFNGLAANSYNVVVKDSNNCSLTYTSNPVVISQPVAAISISNLVSTNVNCFGGNDGSITITATGGTGTYQYSINNGSTWQATASYTTLIAGSYTVMVKDANNCSIAYTSNPVVITQPAAALAVSSVTSTNVLCQGNSDATITITATGGTSNYQYSIDNGSNYQASNTFTGLGTGSYTIKVKDAHNCTVTYTSNPVVITEPSSTVSISNAVGTNLSCSGGLTGIITVTATGGTGALQYSADNGATWTSSNVITGLAAGSHNIRVRDANLCTVAYSGNPIVLTAPDPIIITGTNVTNVLCHGSADGGIEIYGIGGTGTLQFSVDSGATWHASYIFTNLPAGNYNVLVKDGNNCVTAFTTNPIAVTEPAAIVVTNVAVVNNLCAGAHNASITITATGGTGALEYTINNGVTWTSSNSFTSLGAGSYNIRVRDENYCVGVYASNPLLISDPAAIVITSVDSTDVTTYGGTDGTISIVAYGGTGPLQYSIDNGSTWQFANTFNGLIAGGYYIQVKDENGCIVNYWSNPLTISEPSGIGENAGMPGIAVYPDPSQGEITIEAANVTNLKGIEITTIEGKVIGAISAETFIANNMKMKYEFAADVKGMYFVRLLTDDQIYVRKIVVN